MLRIAVIEGGPSLAGPRVEHCRGLVFVVGRKAIVYGILEILQVFGQSLCVDHSWDHRIRALGLEGNPRSFLSRCPG